MRYHLRGLIATSAVVVLVAVGLSAASAFDPGSEVGVTQPPEGCVDVSPGTGEVVYECTEDVGLLRLHLGTSDYFRFEPVEGAVRTQGITSSGCAATLAASPQLVSLTPGPTGATLGERRDSIGVRLNEGGGEPCAQVNNTGPNGQRLTLALGAAPELEGALVDWAEVDIERKYDGVVRAAFFAGGPQGTPAGTLLLGCAPNLSDCGPDSTDGDNFRLDTKSPPGGQPSPDPFDTIVLSLDASGPSNGAFSLEGGADGTAPGPVGSTLSVNRNDSLFHVVDQEVITYEGTLDCSDTATVAVPSDPSSAATSSSVARMENKEGSCQLVPYTLEAAYDSGTGQQTVDFVVGLTGQETAEFEWVLEWDPEPAVYPLAETTTIDFGDGPEPLQWCGGTYDPDGLTPDLRMADVVPITGLGGCLAYQEQALAGGQVEVTEVLLLSNDPRASR
jgi:hypothetical protein